MICGSCQLTDGNIYVSDPERVLCTVTGEYHLRTDICKIKPTLGESGYGMRMILFRGKRLDNGKWYFGSYLFLHVPMSDWTGRHRGPAKDVHYIVDREDVNEAVDPETVGQYTGVVDRNGNRIFEGDILAFNPGDGEETSFYRVEWDNARWTVSFGRGYADDDMTDWESENWTVIGNIYDNPELMEGG